MKNKITYLPIGILTLATALSGVALSSAGVAADAAGSKSASVTVGASCAFSSTTGYTVSIPVYAGNTEESSTTRSVYEIVCNNPSGFVVQAVGNSPDSTHPTGLVGNTAMYGTAGTIATGTSGTGSYWAFKIGYAHASTGGTVTIASGYDSFAEIPDTGTQVLSYTGSTDTTITGTFRPDYMVHADISQAAGVYSGGVKYTMIPNA